MTEENALINAIKLLGYEENEARVYLSSLKLGPATMWEIYQKSQVKRTTCYQIFEKFITQGIGTKKVLPKHTIYAVVDPDVLAKTLESKNQQFKLALPQFEAITSRSKAKPEMSIIKGEGGIFQIYQSVLERPQGSEILYLGIPLFWLKKVGQALDANNQRLLKEIGIRMILSDKPEHNDFLKYDKDEMRQTKFLPKKYFDPPVETQICGNTVSYIIHSEREPFASVVDNPAIAMTERQKFEILWQIAEEKY